MSKVFAAHDVLLNLTSWRNETTDPNAAAGTGGVIGSFWQRNGTNPTTPIETYLKTGLGNFGWCKQNTVNLDVYNVRTYGAVGNGMANDTLKIQAAIDACAAAGGGTVYFPPGNYALPYSGSLGSLSQMDNRTSRS
jgi:polygalacturonase